MKKLIKFCLLFGFLLYAFGGCKVEDNEEVKINNEEANENKKEEYDRQFLMRWSQAERDSANTAINETYLSDVEKEVYFYLNLARINPPLFAETYAAVYDGLIGYSKGYAFAERKESLIKELSQLNSMSVLKPNLELFDSADCFATESGKLGITGHDRSSTGCEKIWHAECCHYSGCYHGLAIVMAFLIDAGENNSELAHRRICLDNQYRYLGVAVRQHIKYEKVAVLDFFR